jgi:peptidoglycan LD-endopeptidase LytH
MSVPTLPPSTVLRRAPGRLALVVVCCVWALVAGMLPAVAQTDADALRSELDQVEAEQAELSQSLGEATARVDDLTARLAQVRDRSDQLHRELEALAGRSAAARRLMDARIRDIYMGDRVNDMMAFATGTSVADVSRRTHYLTAMTRREQSRFEQAAILVRTTQARQAELDVVDARLDELVTEAAQAQADLDARFAAAADASDDLETEIALAEAEARRLAEEAAAKRQAAEQAAAADAAAALAEAQAAERRAAAASRSADRARDAAAVSPPSDGGGSDSGGSSDDGGSSGGGGDSDGGSSAPVSSDGKACPQDNPRSFTDTWGAPRSGGRTHQGTDIFGARGGDVFAIVDGTVEWTTTGDTSGLFLSLRGNDGNTYWYMHLQDFVAGAGSSVSAGQLIAHNGDTGNAQGATPHIHFEYHPGGGSAVNPYPLVKAVCG